MKKFFTFLCGVTVILGLAGMASATLITFDDPLPADLDIFYFDYTVGTAPITSLPTTNSAQLKYTQSAVPNSGNALLTWDLSQNFGSYGVLFSFHSPQSMVSMVGNDFGGDQVDDNEVVFLSAFDSSMNFIGSTTYSGPYAQPDLKPISIGFSDMKYVAFTWNTDLGYYSVDNVEYTSNPVPEPATLLSMGIGLLGLMGYSRKRSKKS